MQRWRRSGCPPEDGDTAPLEVESPRARRETARAESERDEAVKLLRRWHNGDVMHHDTAKFLATIGEKP